MTGDKPRLKGQVRGATQGRVEGYRAPRGEGSAGTRAETGDWGAPCAAHRELRGDVRGPGAAAPTQAAGLTKALSPNHLHCLPLSTLSSSAAPQRLSTTGGLVM